MFRAKRKPAIERYYVVEFKMHLQQRELYYLLFHKVRELMYCKSIGRQISLYR